MEECLYFTRREIGKGRVMAWVFRKKCAKCSNGLMVKPDKKSSFYVCSKCNNQESNEQFESDLVMNIEYTCPHCFNSGETSTEYKRKMFHGVPSYVFTCQKCNEKIGISKKLKETGKRGAD